MIILNTTSDKVQVVLGSATTTNPIVPKARYRDSSTASPFVPGKSRVSLTTTSAGDLVASPSSGVSRIIDEITLYNNDTVANTITIQTFDGTNTDIIFKAIIGAGEMLQYNDKNGWSVLNNQGSLKNSLNQGNAPATNGWNMVVLASDVVNNNVTANTIQDITGLSFAVTSGLTYKFEFNILYTSAVTSTGCRFSVSGPTGTMDFDSSYPLTISTQTLNLGLTSWDLPAASNANTQVASNWATMKGTFTASANGTVIGRFASEVSSSAITAKATKSTVSYIQIA